MSKNIHENHRQRMFARYDMTHFNGFEEHEILEMLLFYVISRRNTNDIAHELLDRFGSLCDVLNAPPEQLTKVNAVGEATARYLNMWGEAIKRSAGAKKPLYFRGKDAERYLRGLFKDSRTEELYMICLDSADRFITCQHLGSGSFESAAVDVNRIVRMAVDYNSAQVVLSHNHPSGVAIASNADIYTTGLLLSALKIVQIKLRDHIIVAGDKCVSIMQNYNIKAQKI